MAVFDGTALAATTDQKWDMDIDDARYEASVVVPRVLSKTANVSKSGDRVHMTYKAKYSVGTVTLGTGAFTPQQMTLTQVDLLIDQWEQIAIEETDRAKAQSFYDPDSDIPKDAGRAFGEQYDNQLLNLHSSFTSNDVGSSGSPTVFDHAMARAALLKLRNRSIPLEDLSFILPPEALYSGLMSQDAFTDAAKIGMPKSVLTTNFRFPLLGVPVYETVKCASIDQSKVGLLIHKSAMAIAFQKKNDIRRADATPAGKLSFICVVSSLYGLKAFRTDHASRLFITAANLA